MYVVRITKTLINSYYYKPIKVKSACNEKMKLRSDLTDYFHSYELLFLFRGEFTGKNVKLKIKYCFESFNRRKVTGNFKYCMRLTTGLKGLYYMLHACYFSFLAKKMKIYLHVYTQFGIFLIFSG